MFNACKYILSIFTMRMEGQRKFYLEEIALRLTEYRISQVKIWVKWLKHILSRDDVHIVSCTSPLQANSETQ